jgi:predicted lipoprotein with Yx(FWY)xxD motif
MATAGSGRRNGSRTGPGGRKAGRVPARGARRVRGQVVGGTLSASLLTLGALSGALVVDVATPAGVAGATSPHVKTIKVSTAKVPNVGIVLTSASGLTLYRFTEDTPGTSKCTGACAKIWPPLLASKGAHVSGPRGVKGLSVMNVGNGHWQVAFHKVPLYRFAEDTKKGQAHGQDVGKVWFAVLKSGIPATTGAAGAVAGAGAGSPTSATTPTPAPATTQPTMQSTPTTQTHSSTGSNATAPTQAPATQMPATQAPATQAPATQTPATQPAPPPPPTTPPTSPPTTTTTAPSTTGGGAAF